MHICTHSALLENLITKLKFTLTCKRWQTANCEQWLRGTVCVFTQQMWDRTGNILDHHDLLSFLSTTLLDHIEQSVNLFKKYCHVCKNNGLDDTLGQTMFNSVRSCAQTKLEGGLQQLQLADDTAAKWLMTDGLWMANASWIHNTIAHHFDTDKT